MFFYNINFSRCIYPRVYYFANKPPVITSEMEDYASGKIPSDWKITPMMDAYRKHKLGQLTEEQEREREDALAPYKADVDRARHYRDFHVRTSEMQNRRLAHQLGFGLGGAGLGAALGAVSGGNRGKRAVIGALIGGGLGGSFGTSVANDMDYDDYKRKIRDSEERLQGMKRNFNPQTNWYEHYKGGVLDNHV